MLSSPNTKWRQILLCECASLVSSVWPPSASSKALSTYKYQPVVVWIFRHRRHRDVVALPFLIVEQTLGNWQRTWHPYFFSPFHRKISPIYESTLLIHIPHSFVFLSISRQPFSFTFVLFFPPTKLEQVGRRRADENIWLEKQQEHIACNMSRYGNMSEHRRIQHTTTTTAD